MPDELVVDFPTLFVAPAWIEAHCTIPDGFHKGRAYVLSDWQLWCVINHYRVKPTAVWRPENPLLGPAFTNRRSQIVGPQKCGKGPMAAAIVCLEARGPALFGGWAKTGDLYRCVDHGCPCGWVYEYEPGEPMGIQWPTPLIHLTASSADQVDNVYDPLQSMIRNGPLSSSMLVREGFIRLPNDGEIAIVTSSAQSRLGNPITFALQDETGLYLKSNKLRTVAETQRRNAAGMGGRTMETTNCWDDAEESVAQRTWEAKATDIFRYRRTPPTELKYDVAAHRRKIHEYVYEGSWWVDLDSIESEALELIEKDPGQAERFFGNRVVRGKGAWMPDGLWEQAGPKDQAA